MHDSPYYFNLHPNEYSQGLHYYPFAVNLDQCIGSCNTINSLSNRLCVPNKTKDLNLNTFNMIPKITESKTLTKHLSYICKCKFDSNHSSKGGCIHPLFLFHPLLLYFRQFPPTSRNPSYPNSTHQLPYTLLAGLSKYQKG